MKTYKLSHTEEKTFKCDLCEKAFAQLVNLKTHKLCYTGENTIKCDLCEKAFAQLHHLKRHKLSHTENKYVERTIPGQYVFRYV